MEIDKSTIERYLADAQIKVELLRTDIQAKEYQLKQSKKEIDSLHWLMSQYHKALAIIEEGEKNG